MAHTAQHTAKSAMDLIEEAGGFAAFLRDYGVGGIFNALILTIISGIQSAGGLLLGPPRALGKGVILMIDMIFEGIGAVLGAGTQATVQSFTDGLAQWLGILAQPASVGVVLLSFWVFMYGINRIGITPWSFIGNRIGG